MEQVTGPAMGRYEIVRPIGEGGMAQVYLCVRRGAGGFSKQLVMKVLHSKFLDDPDYVQMFLDEGRLLSRLQHPNIVSVFEVECVEGVPYLAMEYVNGPTLGRLHKRAVRSILCDHGYLLHIVYQVCLGLHHAHTLRINGAPSGLVHRDVSTQNILIDAETGMAKLIDFGIAKIDEGQEKTQVGVLKGKLDYMAPEVLQGARADARADLYAVGVVLYRLLTNRMPHAEGEDVWSARVSGRYPKASEVAPGLSPQAEAILDKALRPNPAERYQTAMELAADLQAEIERMGTDPAKMPEWLAQLFPGGEEDWSKRLDPNTLTTGTLHIALNRLLTEGGSASQVAPVPPSRMGGVLVGALAGTFMVLLFVVLVAVGTLTRETPAQPPLESPSGYLDAADRLLGEQNFDAARTMNAKAYSLGTGDTELAMRIARQKNDIERAAALAQARSQLQSGQLDQARQTLTGALALNPSDPEILGLFSELEARTPPPVVAEPPPPPALAPPPVAAAASKVDFRSVPAGAAIWVDGVPVGKTPMTWTSGTPGKTYAVEMRLDGYLPAKGSLPSLKKGGQRYSLTLAQAPATLSVLLVGGGWAKVYVDGKELPKTAPFKDVSLPAGTHEVRVENTELGLSKTETRRFAPGEVYTLRVKAP
jgi:serine/threonine protein kinase